MSRISRARFRGCLIGVAVGDAFGAPFEGMRAVDAHAWRKVAAGGGQLPFTDDTHMTFGVTESLLGRGGFDGDNMARIFARDYESEPWRGYGAGPPQVFARLHAGAAWDEAARSLYGGQGSFGNGAAMRVAPVGLRYFQDLSLVADVARSSALITHAHPLGQDGAAAQAVGVACVLRAQPPLDAGRLADQLLDHVQEPELKSAIEEVRSVVGNSDPRVAAARLGNGISALEAVPAALTAFLSNVDSFSDTISFAVAMGGDTDTIASMAGALSGAYLGDEEIPGAWIKRAEGAPSMARLANILFDHAQGHGG